MDILPKECMSNILLRLDWKTQCNLIIVNLDIYRKFRDVRRAKLICVKLVRKRLFAKIQETRSYLAIKKHLISICVDYANPVFRYDFTTGETERFDDRPYSQRVSIMDMFTKVDASIMIKSIKFWYKISNDDWISARSWLLVKCLAILKQPIDLSCMLKFRSRMPKALMLCVLILDTAPIYFPATDDERIRMSRKKQSQIEAMIEELNINKICESP